MTELKTEAKRIAQARDVAKATQEQLLKDGVAEQDKTTKAEKRIEDCKVSLKDIRSCEQKQAGRHATARNQMRSVFQEQYLQ